jgi:DNA-binding response OmpR family regulator
MGDNRVTLLSPAFIAREGGRRMRYVFGAYILDTEQYVLNRAGHSISLQPKVFQVLEYLLIHRDRVVAKQELCEHLGHGQSLEKSSPDYEALCNDGVIADEAA